MGQYASPPVLCCGDLSLCRSSICRRYSRVIGALTAAFVLLLLLLLLLLLPLRGQSEVAADWLAVPEAPNIALTDA